MLLRSIYLAASLLAVDALSGCAGREPPHPDYDPWEGFNRGIFTFNDKLDEYGLEPVARGWDYVVPHPVQSCISRFLIDSRLSYFFFPRPSPSKTFARPFLK